MATTRKQNGNGNGNGAEHKHDEKHERKAEGRNFQDILDDVQERVSDRRREFRDNLRQSRFFKDADKRRLELEERLDKSVSKLLHRFGVPTREDMRKLEKRISHLDREYQKWRKDARTGKDTDSAE